METEPETNSNKITSPEKHHNKQMTQKQYLIGNVLYIVGILGTITGIVIYSTNR